MAEKSLNDLPRDLRVIFTKGNDALQRDNFDYAIDLFNQVLAREPGLHECRKALRTAQQRKAGGGSSIFKKVWSSASSQPMVAKGQIALAKDPAEALQIAEHILNGDPNNSQAHRLVVKAATALEMPHTAVLSLEILVRNSPKDVETAIQLANALAAIGEPKRGERLLAELYRANPTDNELAQALKNLSARQTMDEGGYDALADGSGSYRDILKDKEEAVSLEQQNRQVKSEDITEKLINEYETRLKTEATNLKLVRQLAELYTQKKQFDRALGYYERIKASDVGNDPSLDSGIATTRVRKYEHEIAQLDPNGAEYADKAAALQAEKEAYQLAECQKRVERFPNDLQIRFEMGQLYFQNGKTTEAIAEFQKAQNNPHRRIASMNYLAQCFAKKKMYDLAARRLQDAIKEKPILDDEKKDLIYNLGSVLESMAKKEEAIEQFKLIYEVDSAFKDVAAKVEGYYGGQA
ncbi:MAG TPA: tetratricopeptide repeat protein [Candidatus Binatia bacterium]|jgi:tetratricopeptide (TPR) repeat protein|nr:tetratricopeptide repeat protein [Candidatus Binatia bacterium]